MIHECQEKGTTEKNEKQKKIIFFYFGDIISIFGVTQHTKKKTNESTQTN